MGVATAVASALGRAKEFKKLLFRQNRSVQQTIYLVLFVCVPFALGVYIRASVKSFLAADLGFEASILIGIIGGRLAGVFGGALLALPALFYGEFLTLPINIIAAPVAGSQRHFRRNCPDVWTFRSS